MKSEINIRHAIVSTDIILFSFSENKLQAVLVEVKNQEYFGQKAFPGALIQPEETAEECVKRVIESKIFLPANKIYLSELGAYSALNRDIRGRVVSIAYIGCIDFKTLDKSKDVSKIKILDVKKIKNLAYDHSKMLTDALQNLQNSFSNSTIAQKLLPENFTMSELHSLYMIVLDKEIDKRNFLKKIKNLDIIIPSGGVTKGLKHRPAKLFKFKDKKVKQLEIF